MDIKNELGVIVYFSQEASKAGYEILKIGSDYPDAIITKDSVEYKAEFEYLASNFNQHGHDIRECDIIICWENDLPDCPLPIIALSQAEWATIDICIPTQAEKEAYYWCKRALHAEAKLNQRDSNPNKGTKIVLLSNIDKKDMTREDRLLLVEQLTKEIDNGANLTKQDMADALGISVKTLERDKKALSVNGSG